MIDHGLTWLPFLPEDVTTSTPYETALAELRQAGENLRVTLDPALGDAWRVAGDELTGGETGVLYGAYAYLMARRTGAALPAGVQKPFWPLRSLPML